MVLISFCHVIATAHQALEQLSEQVAYLKTSAHTTPRSLVTPRSHTSTPKGDGSIDCTGGGAEEEADDEAQ